MENGHKTKYITGKEELINPQPKCNWQNQIIISNRILHFFTPNALGIHENICFLLKIQGHIKF